MKVAERRRNRYKILLYVFLGFAIGMLCWAMYAYYKNRVPNTIRIKAGTSEEINLGIPASGVIDTDSAKVIALNHPVKIVAGEESDSCKMQLKLFGLLPFKDIDIEVIENTRLVPVGNPIGIYVKTQGVLVVDTGSFDGINGDKCAPSEYKLGAGDYLTAINGVAITGKKQIQECVEKSEGKEIILQVSRKNEVIQVKIQPELDENKTYKIGVWLRDSAQGIGTMTYIDKDNHFGALGHGINDMDTGELLKLGNGLLYQTEIVSIHKGTKGTPGELTGVIEYQPDKVTGVITSNTKEGIYGMTNDLYYPQFEDIAIPVGLKQDVALGPAQILCNVDGKNKLYDIELTKLLSGDENVNRQISITVTDPELLELTGGIVQGMSGAPIIQNGKLIGAVTHVLVQDSTKGYGIFIEDMLEHN